MYTQAQKSRWEQTADMSGGISKLEAELSVALDASLETNPSVYTHSLTFTMVGLLKLFLKEPVFRVIDKLVQQIKQ